jgi:hypothetical protein
MSDKINLSQEAEIAFRALESAIDDLAFEADKCGAGCFAHDVRGALLDKLNRLVDVCDVVHPDSDE